ncbi:MAG: hypothetical protein JNK79_05520 [Chitinophagaceae bacterium]|nr:hypothetical protein [Chitinophagaceae bacterium]
MYPMTDEGGQESLSPYHFSYNNPIRFNDPDGKFPDGCCSLSDVVDAVNTVTRSVVVVASAAANAWGTNQVGGIGRADVENMSGLTQGEKTLARAGQSIGDAASIVTGAAEVVVGGGGEIATLGGATPAAIPLVLHGASSAVLGAKNLLSSSTDNSGSSGARRKNRLPDRGEPNSTQTNKPGTTTKKYGPDGTVQKEFNKGHPGEKVPKNEQGDHVHDYKPNPNNKSGIGDRQPGREPKRNELKKDFNQ